jgi:hypothetical protein
VQRGRTALFAAVTFGALLLAWQTPALSQQSLEPSDASSGQPPSSEPNQIEGLPEDAPEKSGRNPSRLLELFKMPNFASCPLTDLLHALPERMACLSSASNLSENAIEPRYIFGTPRPTHTMFFLPGTPLF